MLVLSIFSFSEYTPRSDLEDSIINDVASF